MSRTKPPVVETDGRVARYRKDFIKLLNDHAGGDAPWRRFEWWCEAAYCALAKGAALALHQTDRAEALETRYAQVEARAGQYAKRLPELMGMAVMALEVGNCRDFLSSVVSDDDVSALNRHCGQFFTPYEVSRMMAEMTMHDLDAALAEKRFVTVSEPASGAGGMLLAVAEVFRQRGHDPTTRMWFDAGDISPLCYQMTYIQTTLCGMAGVVRCQNTLSNDPPHEMAETFGAVHFLARNGPPHHSPLPPAVAPPVAELPFALDREPAIRGAVQASLF